MKKKIEDEILETSYPISHDSFFTFSVRDYINYLEEKVNNYQFKEDSVLLLSIFPIVSYQIETEEIRKRDRKEIFEQLKQIREKIQVLILQKPNNIDKNPKSINLLKKLINYVESFMIAEFYDMMPHYRGDSFKLMEYLLFEVEEYSVIQDVLNQYPYMIRLIDENGEKLIQKLIKCYLDKISLNKENMELTNSDLIYYDQTLDLFLNHEKLELDFRERKQLVNLVREKRKNILDFESNQSNQSIKRNLVFWLNHLEEKLQNDNHPLTFKEICYMHDIDDDFDEGILSEVRRLNYDIKPNRYPNRKKIDDYIITIDEENSKELDDGISISMDSFGLYKLGTHIADPISFLPKNSIILDEALKRTTTIYLEHPIFMFPEVLSQDKMNLIEKKPRLATSFYMYINQNGEIERYEFIESIVKVRNITYQQVNNILTTGTCQNQCLLDTLYLLSDVVSKINKNFKIDEVYSLLNRSDKNPSNTNIITKTKASKLVEVPMMLTNYIVAYHMNKNHFPCLNRVHIMGKEYFEKISSLNINLNLQNNEDNKNIIHYLKSIYPKSCYSVDSKGHFGLGLPYYSHTTSPLRRGSDLIMKAKVLDPFYFNKVSDRESYKIEEELKQYANYLNKRSKMISSFYNLQKDVVKNIDKVLKKEYD